MVRSLYFGVDCGGTKLRLAVMHDGMRRDMSGPGANATSDFNGCVKAIGNTLEATARALGVGVAHLKDAPGYLAVAGVTGPALAADLQTALGLTRAVVEEDRRASVLDALGDGDGVAAVIGTGSFVARRVGAKMAFQGGYGLALGDEASGAWLGREAVKAALRAGEGFGDMTPYLAALSGRLGGRNGALDFAATRGASDYAQLAPEVVAAAEAGDVGAAQILRAGAEYIAGAVQGLGWKRGETLCLTGGLGPSYAHWLPSELRTVLMPAQAVAPDGALRLAAGLCA